MHLNLALRFSLSYSGWERQRVIALYSESKYEDMTENNYILAAVNINYSGNLFTRFSSKPSKGAQMQSSKVAFLQVGLPCAGTKRGFGLPDFWPCL